jgi:hypothetical protein
MPAQTKVAICTPVFSDPKTDYVRSLLAMLAYIAEHRPDLIVRPRLAQGHLIHNRNLLAKDALDWGADFILWIDADTSFSETSLVSLIGRDLPVVGCNCPTKIPPPRTTVFREEAPGRFVNVFTTPEIARATPIEEVTTMGLGFCLIAARILRALGDPIFHIKPGHRLGLGEDEYLFERIRAGGERIFVDHAASLSIMHIGDFAYTNEVAARVAASTPLTTS